MSEPQEALLFRPLERRVTFAGLLRSEWIKFWSVRSVAVTMIVAFVVTVAVGVVFSFAARSLLASTDPSARAALHPVTASTTGAQFASLIVASVGVIVIAGEFSTGMIRTSFVVAPRRLGVYLAKALVLATNVVVILGVAVLLAFFAGQSVLNTRGFGVSLGADGVLRVVLGTIALLVGVALAGLGVGALLRNTAEAICTVVVAIFVVPPLLQLVPTSWGGETIREYFFTNTTTNSITVTSAPGFLSPGSGLGLFAVWVVVLLGLGGVSIKTRDV